MSPKMPNSRRNLDLAIERVFDDRETALRMRRVMANVIVGQLLPDGVVKGGSAMKIRFGFAATRVSSDLDTARAKDIEAFATSSKARLSTVGTVSRATSCRFRRLSRKTSRQNKGGWSLPRVPEGTRSRSSGRCLGGATTCTHMASPEKTAG